jgi:putative ABC transport system ATP-binding protein
VRTAILECSRIGHTFGAGSLAETVLREVSVSFNQGETCVLLGPSGSGKTTLLSILGCLLTPSSGELRLGGEPISQTKPAGLARLRRDRIGFVFQNAQLLPFLTMEENLSIIGQNVGLPRAETARRVDHLLERLDIGGLRHKRPHQASGGQRQRVAIARALLHRPPILLADEPTAALDWQHGEAAVRLLVEQAKEVGALLITVTHDTRLCEMFQRILHIEGGRLSEQDQPSGD